MQGVGRADHVSERGRLPLAPEAHLERRRLLRVPRLALEEASAHLEADAMTVVGPEDRGKPGIEQRFVVPAERGLDEAAVEERRERILQPQAHGGAALAEQSGGRHPFPRRAVPGGEVPVARHVGLAPARLGQHLVADQEPELDPDAGEADALAPRLRAGGDVVVTGQLAPPHSGAVVHHHEGGLGGVGADRDVACPRVERVGDDLGDDGLFEGAGIGVTQVLEEVKQVDARFAHRRLATLRYSPDALASMPPRVGLGLPLYRNPDQRAAAEVPARRVKISSPSTRVPLDLTAARGGHRVAAVEHSEGAVPDGLRPGPLQFPDGYPTDTRGFGAMSPPRLGP